MMYAPVIMYRLVNGEEWHELPGGRNFIEASAYLLRLLANPAIADIRFDEADLPPGDMRRLDWERFKELCLDFIEEGRGRREPA